MITLKKLERNNSSFLHAHPKISRISVKLSTVLSTNRKDDQKITDVELEKLTDLNLDAADNASEADKIHDLTGLEAAKNLKTLRNYQPASFFSNFHKGLGNLK